MIMAEATKSVQLIRHLDINKISSASRRRPQRELKWEGNITLLRQVIFRDMTLYFRYTGLIIHSNQNCRSQY